MIECQHKSVEPRNRRGAIWNQCLTCWQSVGTAIKKSTFTSVELGRMAQFDEAARESWWRKQNEAETRRISEEREQQSAEWWANYNAYLESPRWAAKRKLVLERDNYLCQACRSKPATHVHHTTYAHLGDEPCFELESVCAPCHEKIHNRPMP